MTSSPRRGGLALLALLGLLGCGAENEDFASLPDAALPHSAVRHGDVAGLRSWLEAGGHLAERDLKGRTPLDLAAELGRGEILQMLLVPRLAEVRP